MPDAGLIELILGQYGHRQISSRYGSPIIADIRLKHLTENLNLIIRSALTPSVVPLRSPACANTNDTGPEHIRRRARCEPAHAGNRPPTYVGLGVISCGRWLRCAWFDCRVILAGRTVVARG